MTNIGVKLDGLRQSEFTEKKEGTLSTRLLRLE